MNDIYFNHRNNCVGQCVVERSGPFERRKDMDFSDLFGRAKIASPCETELMPFKVVRNFNISFY